MFGFLQKAVVGTAAAIALGFAAQGAGASTVDALSNITAGGTYNMVGGPYSYGETFQAPDGAGFRDFTFTNLNTVDQNIALTVATVNTLTDKFTGGITFKWLTSGLLLSVAETATFFSGSLDNIIAAGSSDTLRITFGDPAKRNLSKPDGFATFNVQIDATPVPLPAGGLLLLGALGGLAAFRRRKTA